VLVFVITCQSCDCLVAISADGEDPEDGEIDAESDEQKGTLRKISLSFSLYAFIK